MDVQHDTSGASSVLGSYGWTFTLGRVCIHTPGFQPRTRTRPFSFERSVWEHADVHSIEHADVQPLMDVQSRPDQRSRSRLTRSDVQFRAFSLELASVRSERADVQPREDVQFRAV